MQRIGVVFVGLAHIACGSTSSGDSIDGGAAAEPALLCCVEIQPPTNALNTHCGMGATAPCGAADTDASTTTYNSAVCNSLVIGSACLSWPVSYGSPSACASSEPCCVGAVQTCP